MSKYDRDILIENIRSQMKNNEINQQQLGDAIGMSQPNISKALNPKEKKNFTIAQVADIADFFHVSVDSLLGRRGITASSITPRSIARFLVQLIECDDAELFDYEKHENIFQFHDSDYSKGADCVARPVKYPAFYLQNYRWVSQYADEEEQQVQYQDMCNSGNETAMIPVNNFLQHFREVYPLYKEGVLSEDDYKSILNGMLNKLNDH